MVIYIFFYIFMFFYKSTKKIKSFKLEVVVMINPKALKVILQETIILQEILIVVVLMDKLIRVAMILL